MIVLITSLLISVLGSWFWIPNILLMNVFYQLHFSDKYPSAWMIQLEDLKRSFLVTWGRLVSFMLRISQVWCHEDWASPKCSEFQRWRRPSWYDLRTPKTTSGPWPLQDTEPHPNKRGENVTNPESPQNDVMGIPGDPHAVHWSVTCCALKWNILTIAQPHLAVRLPRVNICTRWCTFTVCDFSVWFL
jgi:hypothetical protein